MSRLRFPSALAAVLLTAGFAGSAIASRGGASIARGESAGSFCTLRSMITPGWPTWSCWATTTGKVPNTSATAASSGADLNGMAAHAAARILKDRLVAFAAKHFKVPAGQIAFVADRVQVGNRTIAFEELIQAAYLGG